MVSKIDLDSSLNQENNVMQTFDRGDIVRIPQCDERNPRFCLILSTRNFNQLGSYYAAPIVINSDTSRLAGFTVPFKCKDTPTQGYILMTSVRSIKLNNLKGAKIGTAPPYVIEEALTILNAIFN